MTSPSGLRPEESITIVDPSNFSYKVAYRRRTRGWQKAPFDLPLSYFKREGIADPGGSLSTVLGSPKFDAQTIVLTGTYDGSPVVANLAIKSYEKLRGKAYDTASLGVDFVEYHQSLEMVEKSAKTLIQCAKSIKRGDLLTPIKLLKMHIAPPGVSARKSFANNWLEYHFGWEPLIKDIYDAVDVLNNPLKAFGSVRAAAQQEVITHYKENLGSITREGNVRQFFRSCQGLTVKAVDNWGLHTLDQFGVINPLSLAWEVIPFSFVVDWFFNVGNVLGSLTDFAGLTLANTYNTLLIRTDDSGTVVANPGFSGPARRYAAHGVYFQRASGLTSPTFSRKGFRLPSKERAATAISLLIQQLRGR